jgi:hypothetical protein
MARGIEELAEMQVTGPVQGGDMVMKPDQAPVGAAALLSKMAKKNTPGIFKLPMPDNKMPDFMKVAAEGVEQQTAKGDSINQMAGELLRQGINIQGMGMDEIIQIYEQTFGSPGDVDEFGVSENLFPGNFTNKEQDVVMLPKNLKTAPDAEETELAYITPDEQALLAFMKPGTPHVGPENVPSYDSIDYDKEGNVHVTTGEQASAMEAVERGDAGKQQRQEVKQMSQEHKDVYEQGGYGEDYANQTEAQKEAAGRDAVTQATEKKDDTMLDKGLNLLGGTSIGAMMKGTDTLAEVLRNLKIGNVKDFIKDEDSAAGWANLLNQFASSKNSEGAFQSWLEDEEGAWKDTMLGELKDDPGMEDKTKTTFDEVLEFMKTKHGGSEEWKKRFGDDKAEYWKDNTPQTGGQAENMASNLTMNDIEKARDSGTLTAKEARRLSYELQQARDTVSEQQDKGQDRHPGTRRPIEEQITEEEVATTTTDPRAGAFNVGGTMPYTEDIRTAGVETDVPLGRRFDIDKTGKYRGTTGGMGLNEAMDYATLGGYQQLEPFQEYLTRRRKHLGEDKPVYFDEEGNVIYSETETT